MQRRQIRGTTGWRKHEITLDVPINSYKITFGILLSGESQVWIDDISFEIVGNDVPTTDIQIQLPESPTNLNFETLHM